MSDDSEKRTREETSRRIAVIIISALLILSALGAVGCLIALIVTENDVLFIPLSVSLVFAIISFTFFRFKR